MSRNELIDAYVTGAINRRAFVQGLTALGVSASVAASYAVALEPASAGGTFDYCDFYQFYPDLFDRYCKDERKCTKKRRKKGKCKRKRKDKDKDKRNEDR